MMPTKAKPKAKPKAQPKPRWSERAVQVVKRRPWLTWGTVASIAAVVSGAISGVMWIGAHFQSAEAAETHEKLDAQNHLATMYETQSIKSLLLGNRVIDCRTKDAKTKPDAQTCAQAELDYKQSINRERILYQQTLPGAK